MKQYRSPPSFSNFQTRSEIGQYILTLAANMNSFTLTYKRGVQ